jgi:hypothetical protein
LVSGEAQRYTPHPEYPLWTGKFTVQRQDSGVPVSELYFAEQQVHPGLVTDRWIGGFCDWILFVLADAEGLRG